MVPAAFLSGWDGFGNRSDSGSLSRSPQQSQHPAWESLWAFPPFSRALCSPLTLSCQVPCSRLCGAWSHQWQICIPQKCIWLPIGCSEAERGFP